MNLQIKNPLPKNNAIEHWVRWRLANEIDGCFVIDEKIWADDGFIIKLSSDREVQQIEMIFPTYVEVYQYGSDNYKNTTFVRLKALYGQDFYKTWSFFKVTNSTHLEWISQKSSTVSDYSAFTHYCIVDGDEVINILTNCTPKLTITFRDNQAFEMVTQKSHQQARRGVLEDGRKVNMRLTGRDGRITMDIQMPNNSGDRVKIRYGNTPIEDKIEG